MWFIKLLAWVITCSALFVFISLITQDIRKTGWDPTKDKEEEK